MGLCRSCDSVCGNSICDDNGCGDGVRGDDVCSDGTVEIGVCVDIEEKVTQDKMYVLVSYEECVVGYDS
jgi:hypothetical protein